MPPTKRSRHICNNDLAHPKTAKLLKLDFKTLAESYPDLKPHLREPKYNPDNVMVLNHADPRGLVCLAAATFRSVYNIDWDLPERFLAPTLPSRANYIHAMADLLKITSDSSPVIRMLDIGVGANCVYPLLAYAEYNWKSVGTDIDRDALEHARNLVQKNKLQDNIKLILQPDGKRIFEGIECFDEPIHLTVCNPPFYTSDGEFNRNPKRSRTATDSELASEGGCKKFILNMIMESKTWWETSQPSVIFFSCLVPHKETIGFLTAHLRTGFKVPYFDFLTLYQGKQTRWVAVWSWNSDWEKCVEEIHSGLS